MWTSSQARVAAIGGEEEREISKKTEWPKLNDNVYPPQRYEALIKQRLAEVHPAEYECSLQEMEQDNRRKGCR